MQVGAGGPQAQGKKPRKAEDWPPGAQGRALWVEAQASGVLGLHRAGMAWPQLLPMSS